MKFTSEEEQAILNLSGLHKNMPPDVLPEVFAHYNHPDRHYHDWTHALSVLAWVNHICNIFTEYDLTPFTHLDLKLAALFHDVIYDTQGTPANEERSAALLSKLVDLNYRKVGPAEALIMATAKHGKLETPDVDHPTALFLDCDIHSFGEPRWETVLWTEHNLVDEFLQRFTLEQVKVGRKAFLGGMLDKKSIFLSDYFKSRFELQARNNIQRILAELYPT